MEKTFQSKNGSLFHRLTGEGEPERFREDSGCLLGEKESEAGKSQGEFLTVKQINSGSPLPIDHDTLLVEGEETACLKS